MNRFTISPMRSAMYLALTSLLITASCWAESPIVPDPHKTPGDVLTTDASAICTPGYAKKARNVTKDVKKKVYQSYGITSRKPNEYEVDHLISLELGGSNSIRNLWPESFVTTPLNAHVKDDLENKLHEMICNRQISVQEAQDAIAQDWIAAYQKYLGPLPNGVNSTAIGVPARMSPQHQEQQILSTETSRHSEASSEPALPDTAGNCPPSAPVKISKKGIYHDQGDANYERTKAKHCFATTEDAIAAGFRAAKH